MDYKLNFPFRPQDPFMAVLLENSYARQLLPRAFTRGVPYRILRIASDNSNCRLGTEAKNIQVQVCEQFRCPSNQQNAKPNSCIPCKGKDCTFVVRAMFKYIPLLGGDPAENRELSNEDWLAIGQQYADRGFDISCMQEIIDARRGESETTCIISERDDEKRVHFEDEPCGDMLFDNNQGLVEATITHVLSLHNVYGLTPVFPVMYATYLTSDDAGTNSAQVIVTEAQHQTLREYVCSLKAGNKLLNPYNVLRWIFEILFSLTLGALTVGFQHRNLTVDNVGLVDLGKQREQIEKDKQPCGTSSENKDTKQQQVEKDMVSYWEWGCHTYRLPVYCQLVKILNFDKARLSFDGGKTYFPPTEDSESAKSDQWSYPFPAVLGPHRISEYIKNDLSSFAQSLKELICHRVDSGTACNKALVKNIDQILGDWCKGKVTTNPDMVSKQFQVFLVDRKSFLQQSPRPLCYKMPPPPCLLSA